MMKLGGLHMPSNGFPLGPDERSVPVGSKELAELTYPIYCFLIRTFGTKRCMFESNFPVDKWCVSYKVLWNTFKRVATAMKLTDAEKADLFSLTACRVYSLDDPTNSAE